MIALAPSARNGSIPLIPPMWKSGWPESQTSSAVAPISWIQLQRGGDEVGVGEDRALRAAGRARRVAEQRGVVRVDGGLRRRLVGRAAVGHRRASRRPSRRGCSRSRSRVSRKLIGTAIAPSRWQASSVSGNSRPLWSSMRHAVAGAHAARGERAGHARRAVVQLGVRALDAVEDERGAVRVGSRAAREQLGIRSRRQHRARAHSGGAVDLGEADPRRARGSGARRRRRAAAARPRAPGAARRRRSARRWPGSRRRC